MKRKALIGFLSFGSLAAIFAVGSMLFVSSSARAQFAQGFAEQRMHQTFQVMKNNVDEIYEPVSEKERWQANVAMWQAVLTHLNDTQNTNSKLLRDTLQIMENNVNRVMQPAERERWDHNVVLWRLMLARLDDPTILSLAQVNAALGAMDANVCCIVEPREHERWQANHDLWQLLVARWANQFIPTPAL